MLDTRPLLIETDFPALERGALSTLQVNLGYLCNQSCTHCHVNAGPRRTELMDRTTIELVLDVLRTRSVNVLDLTGGAPEMNPHFQYLVAGARQLGAEVIDRCNLTILMEPGYSNLHEYMARHQVQITASLPCYGPDNVAEQRGKGVFEASIAALRKLNDVGYGRDQALGLNLVYNPNGAFLPPAQHELEAEYKTRLREDFGIVFDNLFTLANMPVSRFGGVLLARQQYHAYMQLLKDNFVPANLHSVMCRTLVSVDWQGYLYDCDFNQMLGVPMQAWRSGEPALIARERSRPHLRALLEGGELQGQAIAIGEHCYGCTAGQGSSCGGSLNQ